MFLDAFEDNKDCSRENQTIPHGADSCNSEGRECKICIDGWLVDKVRGHNRF